MPKKKSDYTLVHINVTGDQKYNLDEMGGVTEGFRKIYAFWYANYELFEEQEKKRIKIRKSLEGLK